MPTFRLYTAADGQSCIDPISLATDARLEQGPGDDADLVPRGPGRPVHRLAPGRADSS